MDALRTRHLVERRMKEISFKEMDNSPKVSKWKEVAESSTRVHCWYREFPETGKAFSNIQKIDSIFVDVLQNRSSKTLMEAQARADLLILSIGWRAPNLVWPEFLDET